MITTATLRDATGWDDLVSELGLQGLVRHGLRHTALTWMADAGVELHLLQRVAGHQDPAVTARYLHPDHEAVLEAGRALSAWWAKQAAWPGGCEVALPLNQASLRSRYLNRRQRAIDAAQSRD